MRYFQRTFLRTIVEISFARKSAKKWHPSFFLKWYLRNPGRSLAEGAQRHRHALRRAERRRRRLADALAARTLGALGPGGEAVALVRGAVAHLSLVGSLRPQ